MNRTISALFDGAVLHPAEPLELAPNTRVLITVAPMVFTGVSPFCVYTMHRWHDLDQIYNQGRVGSFTERKKWVTGKSLLREAEQNHQQLPILFSAADQDSGLIYYAMLWAVNIDESNPVAPITTYSFTSLTPLDPPLPKSSLILRSTGKPLSEDAIRPYAICYTPEFLMK